LFHQIERPGDVLLPSLNYLSTGPIAKNVERSKDEKHSVKRRAKVPETVACPDLFWVPSCSPGVVSIRNEDDDAKRERIQNQKISSVSSAYPWICRGSCVAYTALSMFGYTPHGNTTNRGRENLRCIWRVPLFHMRCGRCHGNGAPCSPPHCDSPRFFISSQSKRGKEKRGWGSRDGKYRTDLPPQRWQSAKIKDVWTPMHGRRLRPSLVTKPKRKDSSDRRFCVDVLTGPPSGGPRNGNVFVA
jgi:hypothetical protein